MIYEEEEGEEEQNRSFILIWRTKHERLSERRRSGSGWVPFKTGNSNRHSNLCLPLFKSVCLSHLHLDQTDEAQNPAGICFHLASDASAEKNVRPRSRTQPFMEPILSLLRKTRWNLSLLLQTFAQYQKQNKSKLKRPQIKKKKTGREQKGDTEWGSNRVNAPGREQPGRWGPIRPQLNGVQQQVLHWSHLAVLSAAPEGRHLWFSVCVCAK